MAAPTPPSRKFDFSSFSVSSPNSQQPGDKLDLEFDEAHRAINEIITNLGLIQRSDGALANDSVGFDQVAQEVIDDWYAVAQATVEANIDANVTLAQAAASDAQNARDAAEVYQDNAQTYRNQAQTAKTAAEAAEIAAETARDLAQGYRDQSQTNANVSSSERSLAESAQATAELSADYARKWAEWLEGEIPPNAQMSVDDGHYSARFWALRAENAAAVSDRLVGSGTTQPTTRPGGAPLQEGDLWWHATENVLYIYDADGGTFVSVTASGTQAANLVSYDNTTSGLTATDVQAAIDEMVASFGSNPAASSVTYNNTTSGLTATDVQAALDEIEARVDTAETNIGTLQGDVSTLQTDVADHIGSTDEHPAATVSLPGFMSAADKSKLDGIAANADVSPVASVNGQTGAVSLALDDLSDVSAPAPATGHVPVWNGSAWVAQAPSGGATVTMQATPPSNPNDGDLWIDTDTGKTYVYFDDGDTQQWILQSNPFPQIYRQPAGLMQPWAGAADSPPTDALIADGRAVSRTTYSRLFAAIGTTYGPGDGSTTFNLPDMRGVTLIGVNDGTLPNGADGARATRALADAGGAETVVLTENEVPAHAHDKGTLQASNSGSHSHGGTTNGAGAHGGHLDSGGQSIGNGPGSGALATGTSTKGNHSHAFTTDIGGAHAHAITGNTGSYGGGAAHENMPPFLAVNWIIWT